MLPMKVELNQSLILKLAFSLKPTAITNGKTVSMVENSQLCMITDSHRSSPAGFGVKVGATKKPASSGESLKDAP